MTQWIIIPLLLPLLGGVLQLLPDHTLGAQSSTR